jgi:shikimate kinase
MVIFLIGYMGSGKSTIGRKLANKLNFQFFDTDRMVEERFNLNEFEIYQKYGIELYRKTEKEIIHSLNDLKNVIIACGGDLPCYTDNMEKLNRIGKTIYIKMSPKSLAIRLFNARKKRISIQPYLKKMEELEDFIENQLQIQEIIFNQANYIYKGESINIEHLISALGVEKA